MLLVQRHSTRQHGGRTDCPGKPACVCLHPMKQTVWQMRCSTRFRCIKRHLQEHGRWVLVRHAAVKARRKDDDGRRLAFHGRRRQEWIRRTGVRGDLCALDTVNAIGCGAFVFAERQDCSGRDVAPSGTQVKLVTNSSIAWSASCRWDQEIAEVCRQSRPMPWLPILLRSLHAALTRCWSHLLHRQARQALRQLEVGSKQAAGAHLRHDRRFPRRRLKRKNKILCFVSNGG